MSSSPKHEQPNVNTYLAFGFGVFFLAVLAYAGLRDKTLDDPGQFFILRVLVAIAAAGIAATIPGFLEVSIGHRAAVAVRAGGAIAVFVIIFVVNPPAVISPGVPVEHGPTQPEMVEIKGGCFEMGSSPESEPLRDQDEVPHEVCVADFSASKHEITFDQYNKFAAATGRAKPSDDGWGGGTHPVINVSQRDANAYAAWLSDELGQEFRLPTEAEWEYLARAGSGTSYWWGSRPSHDFANFSGMDGRDRFEGTAPVGSFDANAFGLYDTAGNVWELTCSQYSREPNGAEAKCAEAGYSGDIVIRGGGFESDEKWIRSAARGRNRPSERRPYFGFRVVSAGSASAASIQP